MARTESTMLKLGTEAPDFALPDTVSGSVLGPADLRGEHGLIIAFICNHCPYVIHIREAFASAARDFQGRGIGVAAISSNDAAGYPADGPDRMAAEARAAGYTFPYLYDETQAVARAYQAACTPDLYLYDTDLKLVYRGQFDASRPGNGVPVTGADLRLAVDALLANQPPVADQTPSVGCSIKWRAGNQPPYFG